MRSLNSKHAIVTIALALVLSSAANGFAADEVQIFHRGCLSGQAPHCNLLHDDLSHVSVGDWSLTVLLHYVTTPTGTDSEYLTIRQKPEPLPAH
jgi:hypothetical protein